MRTYVRNVCIYITYMVRTLHKIHGTALHLRQQQQHHQTAVKYEPCVLLPAHC
jgi:hypothetical protein